MSQISVREALARSGLLRELDGLDGKGAPGALAVERLGRRLYEAEGGWGGTGLRGGACVAGVAGACTGAGEGGE